MSNKKLILITLALLGVSAIGLFLFSKKETAQQENFVIDSRTTRINTKEVGSDFDSETQKSFQNTDTESKPSSISTNNISDNTLSVTGQSLHIKDEPGVRIANLSAVDGSKSFGTAYITRKDGKLKHIIEASMSDPATGSSYEGWLVQPNTKPIRFFSTGVMTKNSSGLWVLEFSTNMEYPAYNNIVITEETKVDKTPEKHIIEGVFK